LGTRRARHHASCSAVAGEGFITPADIAALMLCSSNHSHPSSPMRCLQRNKLDGSQSIVV